MVGTFGQVQYVLFTVDGHESLGPDADLIDLVILPTVDLFESVTVRVLHFDNDGVPLLERL